LRSPPPEDALRAVIAEELASLAPDTDAYQKRMHTGTVLKAAREMASR